MRRLLDEREVEEYADAGVNPILPTSVEQSPIFTPADTGPDVLANLNAAGLKEEPPSIVPTTAPTSTTSAEMRDQPDLNQILYGGPQQNINVANATTAAQNMVQAQTPDPSKPQDLAKSILLNPELMQSLSLSRQQAFDLGEASSYVDPGLEFGGYTFRQTPGSADFSGTYTPGGFTAIKKDTAPTGGIFDQLGVAGKPVEITYTYDNEGNVTGLEQRFFKGSDSGITVRYDASGNPLDAREFDYSEAWKQTAIPLLEMAALAAAPYLKGAGLFTKAAAGAGFGAANAALRGVEGSDLLKAAALGGVGSAVGAGLGDAAGKAAGEFAGNLFTNPDIASVASQAARGAVESGIKALPGAIATGDTGRLVSGALTGGALGAASSLTGDIELPFTKQQAEAGINLIRAVNSGNMISAANSAAALINNPDITVATRAATLLKAMQSGNINAIMAAAQMLGNTVAKSSKTPIRTAEAPGGAFETSAIIDEFGDMGGTLVPGEGGDETVNVFGTRSPGDIALDYFFSPEDTTVNQRVGVEGTKIKPEELGTFVDLFDKDLVDQRVDVSGSRIVPSLTGADLQSVGVTGTRFPIEGIEDVTDLESVLKEDPNKVDVIGKSLKTDDVTNQTVGVTSTRLPKEDVKETTSTTTTTTKPTTTKPTTRVPTPTKKTTATPSAFTPIPESAPQMPVRPGVVKDAYEVLFGAGAPSLMGFSKAERAKQILALKRQEEENEPDTPYDRLMAMAERDPVDAVDRLMKIIEGN